jgi:hypothetical protein
MAGVMLDYIMPDYRMTSDYRESPPASLAHHPANWKYYKLIHDLDFGTS